MTRPIPDFITNPRWPVVTRNRAAAGRKATSSWIASNRIAERRPGRAYDTDLIPLLPAVRSVRAQLTS